LDFAFSRTLIARIAASCSLFVFLRSCLCYGLLSAQSLAVPALPFTTVIVTDSGYLLSDNKFMPMPGTPAAPIGRVLDNCSVVKKWWLFSGNKLRKNAKLIQI